MKVVSSFLILFSLILSLVLASCFGEGGPTIINKQSSLVDIYPSWSPDGKKIIYHRRQLIREGWVGGIFVYDMEKEENTVLWAESGLSSPSYSPDQK